MIGTEKVAHDVMDRNLGKAAVGHTPGPWHRNIKPARKYNTIFAGQNTHVAHLEVTGLTDEEIEGNCNLITAAPDLLDALSDLMKSCANWAPTIDRSRARAAIAKATNPK